MVSTLPDIVPLSVDAYHLLYDRGLIPEQCELIEGAIYTKMTKHPLHAETVRKIIAHLYRRLPESLVISSENPLTIGSSEPEPDIAILPAGDYSHAHPQTALLVIEVASTTLAFDRRKAGVYASGGIPEYLIFNLNDRIIEVHQQLQAGRYAHSYESDRFVSNVVPGLALSFPDFVS
ncbi:MAG: Uma2 family endonuclease [Spirochaetales bacterium]|nr:Uma2 family endonuclease [Spirochaetales bacterium]